MSEPAHVSKNSSATSTHWTRNFYIAAAILAILALGWFLRVYQLDKTPPGLFYDEGFNAITARNIARGVEHSIFFTGNNGQEPLQGYVAALMVLAAGDTPWALRMSNAMLGLVLVAAIYFCANSFFPGRPLLALSATFICATLYWAINFSRIGWETNSLPPVLALSAGAVWLAYKTRSPKWALAAGFLTSGAIYTYLAGRLWYLVVGAWIVYLLLFHRRALRERVSVGILFVAAAVLTALPLVLFLVLNPTAVTARVGQVIQVDSVLLNTLRTVALFTLTGDMDPRNDLVGRPALDPILSIFWFIGLAVSVWRWKQPQYAFLLLWLTVMILPSALTEFAPNFRRAIGAMPAAIILCGIGIDWLWNQTPRLQFRYAKPLVATLLALALLGSAWSNTNAYFNEWAPRKELFYTFDVGLMAAAQKMAATPRAENLYFTSDYRDHFTVFWAMDGRDFSTYDDRRVNVLKNPALGATYLVTRQLNQPFKIGKFFPGAEKIETYYDYDGNAWADLFHVQAGDAPKLEPQQRANVRVNDFARLVGYDVTRTDKELQVTAYWHVNEQTAQDFTVFAQLLGEVNPATNSRVWAQDDTQPGRGTYPTSKWRVGETIIDNYTLTLPPDLPAGKYDLQLGMYLLGTNERLPLFNADGSRIPNDAFPMQSVEME